MGFRFSRRVKILPGIRVNIGKSGISGFTFGSPGSSISTGKRGTHLNTATGIPGLSHRQRIDTIMSGGGRVLLIVLAVVGAILGAILSGLFRKR